MLKRRRFVSFVALGPLTVGPITATLLAPASARALDDGARTGTPAQPAAGDDAPLGPAPREIADLELAGGYRVVRAHGVHHGALPFVLEAPETEGARVLFQVDVLRRDATSPPGVYDTATLSLFLANQRARSTDPVHERGARALGAALERRIEEGAQLPELASFNERRVLHPDGVYDVTR